MSDAQPKPLTPEELVRQARAAVEQIITGGDDAAKQSLTDREVNLAALQDEAVRKESLDKAAATVEAALKEKLQGERAKIGVQIEAVQGLIADAVGWKQQGTGENFIQVALQQQVDREVVVEAHAQMYTQIQAADSERASLGQRRVDHTIDDVMYQRRSDARQEKRVEADAGATDQIIAELLAVTAKAEAAEKKAKHLADAAGDKLPELQQKAAAVVDATLPAVEARAAYADAKQTYDALTDKNGATAPSDEAAKEAEKKANEALKKASEGLSKDHKEVLTVLIQAEIDEARSAQGSALTEQWNKAKGAGATLDKSLNVALSTDGIARDFGVETEASKALGQETQKSGVSNAVRIGTGATGVVLAAAAVAGGVKAAKAETLGDDGQPKKKGLGFMKTLAVAAGVAIGVGLVYAAAKNQNPVDMVKNGAGKFTDMVTRSRNNPAQSLGRG